LLDGQRTIRLSLSSVHGEIDPREAAAEAGRKGLSHHRLRTTDPEPGDEAAL